MSDEVARRRLTWTDDGSSMSVIGSMMRTLLLGLRHPSVQALALVAVLCVYTLVLLGWNIQSESDLQRATEQRLLIEVEKRAQTVGYLLQRWQVDAQRLADAPEISNYYSNQALGMSLEYGLSTNIVRIRERFRAFLEHPQGTTTAVFKQVALIGRDDKVLVSVAPASEAGTLRCNAPLKSPTAAFYSDPDEGVLLIHVPVYHKVRWLAHLVIWLSPQALAELALEPAGQPGGVVGDYLLHRDGSPVLSPAAPQSIRDIVRAQPCEDRHGRLHQLAPARTRNDGADLVLLTAQVPNTQFCLAMLRPRALLLPSRTSPALLATAGALPVVAIVALIVITRVRLSNRFLRRQFVASRREERRLREEIERREQVEAALREHQRQLVERGDQLKAAIDDAHQLAFYDPLTRLANRTLFAQRLDAVLSQAQPAGQSGALLFLDLDRFKRINDTLGHHIGDLLLQQVAQRLRRTLREREVAPHQAAMDTERLIARLGGDEFTVLLSRIEGAEAISRLADELLRVVAKPMTLAGLEVSVTTSIGVSVFPSDACEPKVLTKYADAAMYAAKARGGNALCFYERSMDEISRRRLEQESDLRKALQQGELDVYFQPQVSLATGEVVGAEALVRWQHPSKGLIPPAEFIFTAEESGLIKALTEQVLGIACRTAARWPERCGRSPRVAVNLSGRSFADGGIDAMVWQALAESGLPPQRLELEITETVLLENRETVEAALSGFNRLGVRNAIDDFGTGYSSLSYLKTFSIQSLKIDRAFIADVVEDGNDAAIVRAIITMTQALGIETVAEGVETVAQEAFLRSVGCSVVQGYLCGKPMPSGAFERFLIDWVAEQPHC